AGGGSYEANARAASFNRNKIEVFRRDTRSGVETKIPNNADVSEVKAGDYDEIVKRYADGHEEVQDSGPKARMAPTKRGSEPSAQGVQTTELAPAKTPEDYFWNKLKEKNLNVRTQWTDEGLRKDFDIPQEASLRKLQDADIIRKNGEG